MIIVGDFNYVVRADDHVEDEFLNITQSFNLWRFNIYT